MKRFLLPLLAFLVLVGFLAVGLNRNPQELPSPLVGKPAPTFSLPRLAAAFQSPIASLPRPRLYSAEAVSHGSLISWASRKPVSRC